MSSETKRRTTPIRPPKGPKPKQGPTANARATKRARSSIDTYLERVDPDKRQLLAALRASIQDIVPQAEECISYGIPAYRVDGGVVAGFAATKTGGSYYPFSGRTLDAHAAALKGLSRTKSALHFSKERPLALALVRKLIRTRMAELSDTPPQAGKKKGYERA